MGLSVMLTTVNGCGTCLHLMGWAKTMEWETLANHGVCNATLWNIVEDHMMIYF